MRPSLVFLGIGISSSFLFGRFRRRRGIQEEWIPSGDSELVIRRALICFTGCQMKRLTRLHDMDPIPSSFVLFGRIQPKDPISNPIFIEHDLSCPIRILIWVQCKSLSGAGPTCLASMLVLSFRCEQSTYIGITDTLFCCRLYKLGNSSYPNSGIT